MHIYMIINVHDYDYGEDIAVFTLLLLCLSYYTFQNSFVCLAIIAIVGGYYHMLPCIHE